MPNAIKEQVDSLVKLQTIENEINTMRSKVDGVPGKISALEAELTAFEQGMTAELTQIDDLKKRYREQEREVQLNLERMKKSQEKLNAVKNNKEYQSTLKEIDDLKALSSDIEDEMLENLDQVDAAEKAVAGKKEEFATLSQQIQSDKELLEQEVADCRRKLTALERDRDTVAEAIDPELMETFNIIKGKHAGGLAVVSVAEAVCKGCNVNIPPQLYNELQRSDSLRLCPNCQRIIYWKEQQ